ncbi:alpha/beta-hydrolase [Earliella scabrosa]|nr:alpha/beta-hydrolase [Earliella scabrosa]
MYSRHFLALLTAVLLPSVLGSTNSPSLPRNPDEHPLAVEPEQIVLRAQHVQDAKLRYIRNSGVCETTPGVNQMSGYIDVGTNMSMWFWFFEARESPETAPFTLWLNGGPGCSSMIGLFQEHGPCTVNADNKTTSINPHSWNNLSNIIYIDQPIGSGLSYGTVDVNSTWAASPALWTAFQILFESEEFAQYKNREFILATESYGGHYGPEFVTYFNEQNAKILDGTIEGQLINVSALMINNGWYDPLIHFESYIKFATNAPGYGQLQSDDVLVSMLKAFYGDGGCRDQLAACIEAGSSPESNSICYNADDYCLTNVEVPSSLGRDEYDLRQSNDTDNPFPPKYYSSFLNDSAVLRTIGAEVPYYFECSDAVEAQFNRTGDDARSLLSELGALADTGMKILIWAGDADINCNWVGGHECVLAMEWHGRGELRTTPFTNMTIDGEVVAAYKNVDNFSFARVYDAGHEVPAFKPKASLEIFRQIINMEPLHSVP